MLSQKAMHLSINDDDQTASDSTLQNETPCPSSRASPSNSSTSAKNMFSKFKAAATALPPGKLVKDDSLSLYDTVGSLEIMDPKMDSGLLLNHDGSDDTFDVLQVLGPKQVLGVMDELLGFEMSWHQGFPLYRNLLSSHYIERLIYPSPASLDEATFTRNIGANDQENPWVHIVLRAYSVALIKTCDLVIRQIVSEKYHEEEDFNTNTYERDLLSTVDLEPIQNLLVDAFKWIDAANDTNADETSISAIMQRLELRQHLLYSVVDFEGHRYGRKNTWKKCEGTIDLINWTHSIAEPTPGCYSQKLQFKIASSIPPKPLAELEWKDTVRTLQNLCHSAVEAYSILDFDGFENLLNYVRLLTAQDPQPPVYVRCLMQSFLWHNCKVLDSFTYKEALFAAIEETVLPRSNILDFRNDDVEATFDPRHKMSMTMDTFARSATDAFLDVFVHQCMNRARLDRDLNKAIRVWDELETQAEQVDNDLRPYSDFGGASPHPNAISPLFRPLKAWAGRWKFRQMMWKIEMGFELDLYHTEELSSMYWILANLANSYLSLLVDTQSFNLQRLRTLQPHQYTKAAKTTNVVEFLENDIEYTKATFHFAAALSNMYALLSHLNVIPSPFHISAFSNSELLYAQRVKAFFNISEPACPTFSDMSSLISLHVDSDQQRHQSMHQDVLSCSLHTKALAILSLTEKEMKEAKTGWSQWVKKTPGQARYRFSEERWKADVKNVFRSAVGGSVVCASLRKDLETEASLGKDYSGTEAQIKANMFEVTIPSPAERWHKVWVVPKVTMKK